MARGSSSPSTCNSTPVRGSPDAGIVDGVQFDGTGERVKDLRRGTYFNPETGTGLVADGLREGDSCTVTAVIPDEPSAEDIGDAPFAKPQLPRMSQVPEDAASIAAEIVDEADSAIDGALLAVLRVRCRSRGMAAQQFLQPRPCRRRTPAAPMTIRSRVPGARRPAHRPVAEIGSARRRR